MRNSYSYFYSNDDQDISSPSSSKYKPRGSYYYVDEYRSVSPLEAKKAVEKGSKPEMKANFDGGDGESRGMDVSACAEEGLRGMWVE
jgi:hypothetical protein